MDFLKQFNDRVKRINDGEPPIKARTVTPLANVRLCRLVTVYNGRRKVVAFGLTRYEAGLLIPHVEKRLRRTKEPDDTGKTLFEVTSIVIEEEI
jgi:hypothetical protein